MNFRLTTLGEGLPGKSSGLLAKGADNAETVSWKSVPSMHLTKASQASLRKHLLKHPGRTFLGLSAALVLVMYWRSFASPFVYDDLDQIVNNPNLSSWSAFVQRFLLHPVMLSTSYLGYVGSTYRPLFWLSLFVDRAVWGLHAGGFHATNLVLHWVNGNLLFALLRRLKAPVLPAAAACLLWLALPIDTEVVAWISGRSYALCSLFVLLCLLAAWNAISEEGWGWNLACFAAAACAVLSNELGIVILPLFVLLVFLTRQQRSRNLLITLGTICLAIFGVEAGRIAIGVQSFSGFASARVASLALSKYVALTLFPLHMSVERSTSLASTQLASTQLPPGIALGMVLLLLCFGYAVLRRRTNPALLGGLFWFLICITPFVVLRNYQGLAERFAYLAAMGMAAAVTAVCSMPSRARMRNLLMVVVAAWGVWNLARTTLRVGDWSDPVRLYRSSLRATPDSPALWYNLAYSYRTRGDLAAALDGYHHVVQMDTHYPHGLASLGDVYLQLGSFAAAQSVYQQALVETPDDVTVLLNSGAAYQRAGELEKAEAAYQRVLAIDPASSAAHVNLGVLYLAEKRGNEAAHQFAMAIDLKTTDPTPYYDLGALFQQAGRPDLAMVLYKKVLQLKPGDADTLEAIKLIGNAP